jgi:endonuclease-3
MPKDIEAIMKRLREMHGKPRVELSWSNPLELTVATVLSAQCTDERVNRVTEHLFKRYKKAQDYIDAPIDRLEEEIRETGFYHNKARSLKAVAGEIEGRFGGRIPDDIDTFATVKGIGRKSANMIVGLAFGKPAVIVDTHVTRVSGRVGLTKSTQPERIEEDLKKIVPERQWTAFSLLTILHGRYVCKAKQPECPRCLLKEMCDYYIRGDYEGA